MKVSINNSRFIYSKKINGSKALAHRFLIGAFLANEPFIIENVPDNDDIKATLNFLKAINKEIVFTDRNSCYIKPSEIKKEKEIVVEVNNSYSTLLFLLPISLQLANKVTFICNDSLINKSIKIYEEIATLCNLSIKKEDNKIICSGSINLDYYEVDGSISSQFITGLIINALYLKKAITIKINNELKNKKYVLMSIEVFKKMGFDISFIDNTLYIHNNIIKYWDSFFIEGDYTTCCNYLALACLNGSFEAYNLTVNSLQEEAKIIEILKSIGGNIKYFEDKNMIYAYNNSLLEKGIAKQLKSFTYDLKESINLSFILLVIASYSSGISTFTNYNLLNKDDKQRIDNMLDILSLLKVSIKKSNNITIKGKKDYFNNKVIIDCKNDHKILMALSIFSLLNKGNITLSNIECINKADPDYFNNLIKGCKEGAIEVLM